MSGLRSEPMDMKPMDKSIATLMNKVNGGKLMAAGSKIKQDQDSVKESAKQSYKKSYDNGYTQAMLDMIFAEQAISDAPQEQDDSLRSSTVDPPTLQ